MCSKEIKVCLHIVQLSVVKKPKSKDIIIEITNDHFKNISRQLPIKVEILGVFSVIFLDFK